MTQTLPAPLPTLTRAQQTLIINTVRRAAKAEILPRFRKLSAADIATKAHANDLVTEADTAAEAMIARALQGAFPDALVIGEEAASADPKLLDGIKDAPLAFHIDPVDGTWNFARGLGVFGVIIAATQFGKPIFGLIYDPLADDWAIASSDSGAVMQRPTGADTPLKPAMARALDDLSGYVPLGLFAKEQQAKLAATLPGFHYTGNLRCSAHQYRMLAQGHADFIITPANNPWDHAAGALICAQAGCHVEMLRGGAYDAGEKDITLMVAPDKTTWNRLAKVFGFLTDEPTEEEAASVAVRKIKS